MTDDEAIAILYYIIDLSGIVRDENNVFRLINSHLANRHLPDCFLPYIYFLIQGLNKLPNYSGTVYRGIDISLLELSKQYSRDNLVLWVAFTSTTTDINVMKRFTGDKGTWLAIDIEEGKEIQKFSMYPTESEVLILPNSKFIVKEVLSESMKKLVNMPSHIDCITIIQLPSKERPDQNKTPQWYLVINRLFTDPHEILSCGTDYALIKKKYKQQPVNYSAALIFVADNNKLKIKKFYGNPIFRDGMLSLVRSTMQIINMGN